MVCGTSVTIAHTSCKVKVKGQGHEVKKCYFQDFGWEFLCITTMDNGVMLRCHVTSQNDVMTSSDITKITSVAQKDCRIYDAGGA